MCEHQAEAFFLLSCLRSNVNNQTEACSDHAKSFGAFTDGQQQCLLKLLVALVIRQAELVEAGTSNSSYFKLDIRNVIFYFEKKKLKKE